MPDRPYLFYELTNSLCSTCLRKVEAKVVIQDDRVYLQKWCPEHQVAEGADFDRCRVLQAVAADAQAGADAAEIQHADQIRLPVRLRPLPRSRAALVA